MAAATLAGVAAPEGRQCLRGRARTDEAREEAPPVAAAEAAQSRRALAAARQGRRARQDDGGEAARGECRPRARARAIRSALRMTRWPHNPDTLSRQDLEENRMRDLYAAAVDPSRAFSDEQLSASLTATLAAKPKGAGWWVFAYGSLLWNPLFPGRGNAPGDAARPASPILPVVARLARHARSPGSRAGPRSRRRLPRRRAAPAGDARDRRVASPVAARDGRRLLPSALGEGRRRTAARSSR